MSCLQAGQHLGQNWDWDGGRGTSLDNCHSIYRLLAAVLLADLAHQLWQLSGLLRCSLSKFLSQPGCWPTSRPGKYAYPFAVTLVAANGSCIEVQKLVRKLHHSLLLCSTVLSMDGTAAFRQGSSTHSGRSMAGLVFCST